MTAYASRSQPASIAGLARPAPLPKGLDAAWAGAGRALRRAVPARWLIGRAADRVSRAWSPLREATPAQLAAEIESARRRLRLSPATCAADATELALVCEAARRSMRLEPNRSQILSLLAVQRGCLAELATGEGKTLVAGMAAVVEGWRGRGCHVITANDYLAGRDASWIAPLFELCGVEAGSIESRSSTEQRQRAYLRDVTYLTGREAASDFLRDALALAESGVHHRAGAILQFGGSDHTLLQRGLASAIVDEADAVLIDEAGTPLILAGGNRALQNDSELQRADEHATRLERGRHYSVSQSDRAITFTPEGRRSASGLAGDAGSARRSIELVQSAIRARECYERGKDYLVDDGRVVIIDESTGRPMPDRTWRGGLHQAIEVKEGLRTSTPPETLARISFQRFFRRYERLAGMTGTAREVAGELWATYGLRVVPVPTNKPIVRRQRAWRRINSHDTRLEVIADEINAAVERGQPVLVGTRTVAASEELSEILVSRGIDHQVLNASRVAEEARIIAAAGQSGRVTVATNMAGRGTDIALGDGVAERGGLRVVLTEPHLAERLDRQLAGRSGRQGDPGEVLRFATPQDEALALGGSGLIPTMAGLFGVGARIGQSQRALESRARQRRRSVAREDDWLDDVLGFAGRQP